MDPSAQMFDAVGNWKASAIKWSPSPSANVEMAELQSIVQECLGNLPQGQADVFVLSVMEEMESEAICRELDISPQNMWVRMHRARLGLAKCVGSKWQVDEKVQNHVG